jgi:hypothetical protein
VLTPACGCGSQSITPLATFVVQSVLCKLGLQRLPAWLLPAVNTLRDQTSLQASVGLCGSCLSVHDVAVWRVVLRCHYLPCLAAPNQLLWIAAPWLTAVAYGANIDAAVALYYWDDALGCEFILFGKVALCVSLQRLLEPLPLSPFSYAWSKRSFDMFECTQRRYVFTSSALRPAFFGPTHT